MAELSEVAAYLSWAARQPKAWGEFDCLQGFVSEWVRRQRGGDPAAAWRGRYRTAFGCDRLLRREGGLAAVLEAGAASAGLERIDAPEIGCIAAVEAVTSRGVEAVGAIRTPRGWACLSERGVMTISATPLAMWRV